jgi:hypothetical protein
MEKKSIQAEKINVNECYLDNQNLPLRRNLIISQLRSE